MALSIDYDALHGGVYCLIEKDFENGISLQVENSSTTNRAFSDALVVLVHSNTMEMNKSKLASYRREETLGVLFN